jgi:hypothetical protein
MWVNLNPMQARLNLNTRLFEPIEGTEKVVVGMLNGKNRQG